MRNMPKRNTYRWHPCNHADILSRASFQRLTMEERGVYFTLRLLCGAYGSEDGSFPGDTGKLKLAELIDVLVAQSTITKQTATKTLKRLTYVGILSVSRAKVVSIVNWVDEMNSARTAAAERKRRQRDREKGLITKENDDVSHGNPSPPPALGFGSGLGGDLGVTCHTKDCDMSHRPKTKTKTQEKEIHISPKSQPQTPSRPSGQNPSSGLGVGSGFGAAGGGEGLPWVFSVNVGAGMEKDVVWECPEEHLVILACRMCNESYVAGSYTVNTLSKRRAVMSTEQFRDCLRDLWEALQNPRRIKSSRRQYLIGILDKRLQGVV